MKNTKYVANFQRIGGAYDDTLTLLIELNRQGSWDAVKLAVFEENLLQKNSRFWMVDLLRAVRRRYLASHQMLPNGKQVTKFVASAIPKRSKIQVLYQYIC
ncbi:DUF1819 family protein, partial [Candidatus Bathyarchaeota archaeon]|nr:DUF1819 family protein [Candidatus Bathyarchaeota archaeon]